MRIIIAGGRDFNDFDMMNKEMHGILHILSNEGYLSGYVDADVPNITIVSGTAKGADSLGERFAMAYNMQLIRIPALWDKFGKSAGYIRNKKMGEFAMKDSQLGVLVAFWDGKSKGTKHMIDTANELGLRVFIVNY